MLPLAPLAASAGMAVGQALAGAAASGLSALTGDTSKPSSATGDKAKIQKTAKDFEAMFLEQSLDVLNRSQGTDGPLGENGTGGGVYRSMLNKEYAQSIVQSGGIGIGDQVMREMLRLQGGANG
ncbi:rod-binding protein [Methylobacterium sp. Gmos1]